MTAPRREQNPAFVDGEGRREVCGCTYAPVDEVDRYWRARQWGMFLLSLGYTAGWARGFWVAWSTTS